MVNISIGGRVFENIEGIIFDKDGTLEDSRAYWAEIGVKRSQLIEAQIPGTLEHLLKAFGINQIAPTSILNPLGLMALGSRVENEIAAATYIAEMGRDWLESRTIVHRAFQEADRLVNQTSSLFPDVVSVLRTCRSKGLKLGIVSADTTANVEQFISSHNLAEYIGVAIGSDKGQVKPDPALLISACEALKVPVAKVLMVGDGQTDIEMAKNADAAGVIALAASDFERQNLRAADVLIENLQEIVPNIYT